MDEEAPTFGLLFLSIKSPGAAKNWDFLSSF